MLRTRYSRNEGGKGNMNIIKKFGLLMFIIVATQGAENYSIPFRLIVTAALLYWIAEELIDPLLSDIMSQKRHLTQDRAKSTNKTKTEISQ